MKNLLYVFVFLLAGVGGLALYRSHSRRQTIDDTARKIHWILRKTNQKENDVEDLKAKLEKLGGKELSVFNEVVTIVQANWDNLEDFKPSKQLRADVELYLTPLLLSSEWNQYQIFGD